MTSPDHADDLDEAGEITVRKITALMPAEKTESTLLVRERTRPVNGAPSIARLERADLNPMPSDARRSKGYGFPGKTSRRYSSRNLALLNGQSSDARHSFAFTGLLSM